MEDLIKRMRRVLFVAAAVVALFAMSSSRAEAVTPETFIQSAVETQVLPLLSGDHLFSQCLTRFTVVVFRDDDCNGSQGLAEPGVPGVQVWVKGRQVNEQATTGPNGSALFVGLPPARYRVKIRATGGWGRGVNVEVPCGVSEFAWGLCP